MHFHYHSHRTPVQVCNNSVQPRLVRMHLIPNLEFRTSLAIPTLLVYLQMTTQVSSSPISPPYQFLGPQETMATEGSKHLIKGQTQILTTFVLLGLSARLKV